MTIQECIDDYLTIKPRLFKEPRAIYDITAKQYAGLLLKLCSGNVILARAKLAIRIKSPGLPVLMRIAKESEADVAKMRQVFVDADKILESLQPKEDQ